VPAPHPQRGLAAIDLAKHALDFVAMSIEIVQPVLRGALIVLAAPLGRPARSLMV
jgi:hypothetical protein